MRKNETKRLIKVLVIVVFVGVVVGVAGGYLNKTQYTSADQAYPQVGIGGGPSAENAFEAEKVILNWPIESQRIARETIDKYGQPDDLNSSRLVWNFNIPWERIVLFKEEQQSATSGAESYLLEQRINYGLPDEVHFLRAFRTGFFIYESKS